MENKENKNKIIIGIVIVVVVAIIIGAIVYTNTKNSTNTQSTVSSMEEDKKENESISKIDNSNKPKETEITLEDKITIDNFCEFNITGTSFSKDITPSNPTGYYRYLEGKDDSQKYFELTMNVKNLNNSEVKQDSLLSVKLTYDNNYEYNCALVTEDASGEELETFPNLYNIGPLKSLKYRFVVEVPKELETDGKPLKATITSNGNTYVYNVR